MGCFVVKEERCKDSSIIEREENTEEESFLGPPPSIGRLSREISRVDDFKLTHMDFIGQKLGEIQEEYTLLEPPIGRGAFGEVRRAIHIKSNQTRAVKMIYKETMNQEEQQRMENEVHILKSLDHPNIMKVFGFYQNEHCFYIITEFFSGGELFEEITNMKNFSERRAAITMRQIVSAINFCHQHSIVHRDLKPENILYESKSKESLIKVVDFGTSRFFDSSNCMKRKFGTPYYIAPEVLKHSYTEKCDIWSCGVILYIMLCGFPPFNGQTYKEIMKKVKLGRYNFDAPEWAEVSETAQELIRNMMKYNPEERYTAAQVLNDPWFKLVLGEETFDKPLMISALDNLSKFRAELKLQEAFWLFLISYTATREERDHLLRLFQALDLDGDGKLSREELIIGYTKIMKSENAEEEVEAILKSVDSNRSGTIEYTEFIMATLNRHKMLSKDRLDIVFKLIDKDGDGHIDIQELKEALNPGHQAEIGDEVWRTLIEEVDKDGDGKISYNEFVEMMIKFLEG